MRSLVALLIFFSGLSGFCQSGQVEIVEEWQNFDILADYLTSGGGVWIGENPNHDPDNARSPKQFGLWFKRPLPVLMTLTIVAYIGDSVVTSSQGTFNWHPVEQKVVHAMSDRGDGYSQGITTFPNDSSFISIMKIYRPSGQVYDHKDENFIVSKDLHRNTSYGMDESGNWVERSSWLWRRQPR